MGKSDVIVGSLMRSHKERYMSKRIPTTVMIFRKTDHALVTIKYVDGTSHWLICPQEWHLKICLETYESKPNVQTILIQYN
jgi:hypothetical protein